MFADADVLVLVGYSPIRNWRSMVLLCRAALTTLSLSLLLLSLLSFAFFVLLNYMGNNLF
jgi:hypothetical protein